MPSVGNAIAILSGRRTGDQEEALGFLQSLDPNQLRARNRAEGRVRARMKSKALKPGHRPRSRWTQGG